jgi:hypothetical protein
VRRHAERTAELAAEVGPRQPRRPGQVVDAERLGVARVGEVLGAQQVAGGRDEGRRQIVSPSGGAVARRSVSPVSDPEITRSAHV